MIVVGCGTGDPDRVRADRYDSFWLWAGTASTQTVRRAESVYILDGEVRGTPARFVPLRMTAPKAPNPHVWLVVRTDTLDWPENASRSLAARLNRWASEGNRIDGLQIDFDARTKHLRDYAQFLKKVRRELPARYKLSITGLMDWSANGDPQVLAALKGVVDEVVIQTYQGRSTIWGYDAYFARMKGFPIPFKVGLVENGRWIEPSGLRSEPNFRGYVVFLLARRSSAN